MDAEDTSVWKAMFKTPASMALILYIFVWFVGGLRACHLQTTYEILDIDMIEEQTHTLRVVVEKFKEVFYKYSSFKEQFRPMVPNEPQLPSRPWVLGAALLVRTWRLGKGMDDIEMDRKATWGSKFGQGLESYQGQLVRQ